MLCELCKKRTSTVFYNEDRNGKNRFCALCGECASKLREKGELREITSMIDSFADPFSLLPGETLPGCFCFLAETAGKRDKTCPDCGISASDIERNGNVGCPTCYTVFQVELSTYIRTLHGRSVHTGAVPARHLERQVRIQQLKQKRSALREAVQKENYECAAALRDEIRSLEAETGKEC